jgi:putative ABC transport system permease protein
MPLLDELTRELRYAVRQLTHAPGLTAFAMLALAVGVGGTITVFTLVNGVLLRPLPFERPDELYRIARTPFNGVDQWIAVPELTRWQRESRAGDDLVGFTPMDFNLRGPNPEGLTVVWASRRFLHVLGFSPAIGRDFTDADSNPGAERVALISDELWRRRYGADPAIVGRRVELEGPSFLTDSNGSYTIVGVLPKPFWLFYTRTDFVIPMRASAWQLNDPTERLVQAVLGRIRSSHPEPLRSELAAISRAPGHANEAVSIQIEPLADWHWGDLRRPLMFLMGAAVLAALTACANVALILVARTSVRRRELAIRLAIGAGRGRVIRQLLTESLVLAAAGGLAGVSLAVLLGGAVRALVPVTVINRLPGGYDALSLDWRTAVAAVAAIVVSGLLAGVSSLSACRFREGFDDLRSATPDRLQAGRLPIQTILVIGQTAVAIVLLITGGMLLKSLDHLRRVDLGIEPRDGLVVWLNLNLSRYATNDDRVRFYGAVFEQLAAQPDVAHASGIDMPFNLDWQTTRIATADTMRDAPDRWPFALARAATPTYFERHGIRRVQGRTFTDQDDARSPQVAIVSQTLADRYWPDGSAVGRQLTTRTESGEMSTVTIVGIATDVRSAPAEPPKPIVYRPYRQAPPPWMYVTVEPRAGASAVMSAIRRAVWAVDADQPLDGPSGPWTLREWLSAPARQPRLVAVIGNALAAMAGLLATTGLYGLLSYMVARRTAEFGLRMALGATRGRLVALVLRQTMALIATGVALGLLAAAGVMWFLRGMLFGVPPLDPVIFFAAAIGFVIVALVASIVPARRAMSVSPVTALRSE